MSTDQQTSRSTPANCLPRWLGIGSLLLAVLGAVVQLVIILNPAIPLGVEGEWVWPRQFRGFPSLLGEILLPAIPGLLLIAYLWFTTRRTCVRSRPWLWLAGLMPLGLLWSTGVIAAGPEGTGLERTVFVLYYPRTAGYFHQAKYEAENLAEFLAGYEDSIQDLSNPDNYLHIGTHPPGLTTLNRLLLNACRDSAALRNLAQATQPRAIAETLQFIAQAELRSGKLLTEGDLAALWLSVVVSHLIAVGAIVPTYFLARRLGTENAARWAAGLWPLVPSLLIFLPKSDAVFAGLAMLLQLLWLNSLERRSIFYGFLTGIVFVVCTTLSLAFFTLGLIFLLQFIWMSLNDRFNWRATCGGIAGGIISIVVIYCVTDVNLLTMWLQNFRNHGEFYTHNARSYYLWLGVNLFEAGCGVGLPVYLLSLMGLFCLFRTSPRHNRWILAGAIAWGILWISGKNMGEAARLWLFLAPYALLACVPAIHALVSTERTSGRQYILPGIALLQLAASLLTALMIDGFGFTEL